MGKRKTVQPVETQNEEIIEEIEEIEEQPVETQNEEIIEEIEEIEEQPIIVTGKVSNCDKLNVREKASSSSRVVSVLDKDDEIEVVVNESTDDYYKVNIVKFRCTGYCDKNYITLI